MTNDLEDLFSKQPPYTDEDLDRIITKMRELRIQYEGGMRPKKVVGPKIEQVDLVKLGLKKAPTGVKLL